MSLLVICAAVLLLALLVVVFRSGRPSAPRGRMKTPLIDISAPSPPSNLRRRHPNPTADSDASDEDDSDAERRPNVSRLQRKRLEKARQREVRREAIADAQRQRETAADAQRQREEAADTKRQLEEEAAARALATLREERQRAEAAEYAQWVGAIGVEARGELGDTAAAERERTTRFLTQRAAEVEAGAKGDAPTERAARSILVLSEAARELGVSVEAIAARVEELLKEGTVSGVFDDRGKFIFVAAVHYKRIAMFIAQRGRVSVQELVRECNRVILE